VAILIAMAHNGNDFKVPTKGKYESITPLLEK